MKILIVGAEATNKIQLAKMIQELNDDLIISPMFTTELSVEGHVTDDFKYYLAEEEVQLAYKNNAFMWVLSSSMESHGVTLSDMYSSDIFVMSYKEFNNISNPVLSNIMEDGIIIWLDSKYHNDADKIESSYAYERLSENKYLYFRDDDFSLVAQTALSFYLGDINKREELLNEYN